MSEMTCGATRHEQVVLSSPRIRSPCWETGQYPCSVIGPDQFQLDRNREHGPQQAIRRELLTGASGHLFSLALWSDMVQTGRVRYSGQNAAGEREVYEGCYEMGKTVEELNVGDKASFTKTVTEYDIYSFAGVWAISTRHILMRNGPRTAPTARSSATRC